MRAVTEQNFSRVPGLKCIRCQSEDIRVDQTQQMTTTVRRHRKCRRCGIRFATLEVPEAWLPDLPSEYDSVVDYLYADLRKKPKRRKKRKTI